MKKTDFGIYMEKNGKYLLSKGMQDDYNITYLDLHRK